MRQSPSLLALLTISATLGFASQARADSLSMSTQETDPRSVGVAELLDAGDETTDLLLATIAPSYHPTVETLEVSLSDLEAPVSEDAPSESGSPSVTETDSLALPAMPQVTELLVPVYLLSQEPDGAEEAADEDTTPDDSPAPEADETEEIPEPEE
ncbi:MAG: hypothetical protein F6K42_06950, partial [Leptolyngbya sp. SIO1D8]|nr:hypothetical protein [Leptolyngbya sp. SIO1D8]